MVFFQMLLEVENHINTFWAAIKHFILSFERYRSDQTVKSIA